MAAGQEEGRECRRRGRRAWLVTTYLPRRVARPHMGTVARLASAPTLLRVTPLDWEHSCRTRIRSLRRGSLEGVETGPAPSTQSHPDGAPPATAVPALTPASRRKARIQFAVLCWTLFLAGWNDGTTGPLLHRIQTVYHVRALLALSKTGPAYPDRASSGWIHRGVHDLHC